MRLLNHVIGMILVMKALVKARNKELIWLFFLRGAQSLSLRIVLALIFLFLMKFLIVA